MCNTLSDGKPVKPQDHRITDLVVENEILKGELMIIGCQRDLAVERGNKAVELLRNRPMRTSFMHVGGYKWYVSVEQFLNPPKEGKDA